MDQEKIVPTEERPEGKEHNIDHFQGMGILHSIGSLVRNFRLMLILAGAVASVVSP